MDTRNFCHGKIGIIDITACSIGENQNFNTHRMTVIISDLLVYLRGLESPFEFLNDCEVGVVSIYVKYQHKKNRAIA